MPDWSVFKDIPFKRRFSISKAVLLNQCPGKFGFQYEQKIKEPTGPPIWCGNYFEWLIAGKKNEKGQPCPNPVPMLPEAQQKITDNAFRSTPFPDRTSLWLVLLQEDKNVYSQWVSDTKTVEKPSPRK